MKIIDVPQLRVDAANGSKSFGPTGGTLSAPGVAEALNQLITKMDFDTTTSGNPASPMTTGTSFAMSSIADGLTTVESAPPAPEKQALAREIFTNLPGGKPSLTAAEIKTAIDAVAKGGTAPSVSEITAVLGSPVSLKDLAASISAGMFVQQKNGSISIDSEVAFSRASPSTVNVVPAATPAETQRKAGFEASMETLVEPNALKVLDNVDSLDKSGKANDGCFSTKSISKLAAMRANDDATWNKIAPGVPTADRQRYIDAAKVAIHPDNAALLKGYSGGDSVFEKGELQGMVTAHMPKAPEADKNAFYGFARTLASPSAVKAMDNLEAVKHTGKANNGRFGTAGMAALSQQTAGNNAFWNSIDPKLTVVERQSFIDAAKGALDPKNAKWLNELSGGDGIFERGEMQEIIAAFDAHAVSNGSIDPSNQGQMGDCWVLSSINAMAATPGGREILQKSIFQNNDGSYTVTFKGDPEHPIFVTAADLKKQNYSKGDKDVRILEIAFDKYVGQNPEFELNTISKGGRPENALTLLAGQHGKAIGRNYDPAGTRGLLEILGKQSPIPVMTFDSEVGEDGSPGVIGNGRWHAFSIEKIDLASGTVTFANPWNSGKPITMSLDEASKKIAAISFVDTTKQA